ncbi:PQQ-dependent sugar dehydrogenase [Rubellimicrobium aerolatum]|uniref:PQQ-dependent sugar dehydrogenase n=1 Tax=Rubellimicrobium aerolatum TaxID=490979 RepID=A0ABW0SG18_9RHOB|nr:PQQ-dependent sugar dehydrogenase [Rubellimicrobium aerolatum]MBP1806431.1 glucose/arabinose dehydrogenase [Rubellimicrobium aerolatum]
MRAALSALALLPLPALAAVEQGSPNAPFQPAFENQTRAPELPATAVRATPFAGPLENPWGIAALPDGTFLVTEKPGRLRLVMADGTLSEPIGGLPEVDPREQGGLLDVAVSPEFQQDRTVFWTYAKPMGQGLVATAAARGTLSEDGTQLTEVRDIFVQTPASESPMHYGSRVVPAGDGLVYVTTGEHSQAPERERAQDVGTTWGKVVRLTVNGEALSDNPFVEGGRPETWTLGHRNVQGAALDDQGRLWVSEMGPLGGDELNLIERGANYGWPVVSYGLNYDGSAVGSGEPRAEGFVEPVYYWDPVIAPGGIDFYAGDLFPEWRGDLLIAALRGSGLVRLDIQDDRVAGEERMLQELGRVRDVEELGDGSLVVITDDPQGGIYRVTSG